MHITGREQPDQIMESAQTVGREHRKLNHLVRPPRLGRLNHGTSLPQLAPPCSRPAESVKSVKKRLRQGGIAEPAAPPTFVKATTRPRRAAESQNGCPLRAG